jgi:hypothetical protein
MRKASIALAAALAVSLSLAAGAQASCGSTCLNHRVKQLSSGLIRAEKKIASLTRTVSQQGQTIATQQQAIEGLSPIGKKVESLYKCLFEVPVNEYGEPGEPGEGNGYLYENATETFQTTALDVVAFEGESVGAWFLIDGCNTATTASVQSTRALAPRVAGLPTLPQPQRRLFP